MSNGNVNSVLVPVAIGVGVILVLDAFARYVFGTLGRQIAEQAVSSARPVSNQNS